MSQISDAITALTASVGVLTTTVGGIDVATPTDVSNVQAQTTAVNAAITTLGGTPPA